MNKEYFKKLSDETFFDNDTGGIIPSSHRGFNSKLIDAIPDPATATATTAGLVKSSIDDLEINVKSDGTMKVNGLTDALGEKQNTAINIVITNFNTFTPYTNVEVSKLKVGEACYFSSDNAIGRPAFGSDTVLSNITRWSGTITYVCENCHMLTAVGANTYLDAPQMATRMYNGHTRRDWTISTDYSVRLQNGYVKLPSGLLIQWGSAPGVSSGNHTVYYPLAFAYPPFVITTTPTTSSAASEPLSAGITNKYNSYFTASTRYALVSSAGAAGCSFYWCALGQWR